jgi:hypothetical protein
MWTAETQWTLVEDLRLGIVDGEGPELFGRIRAFDVDDQGRIYVLDGDALEVRAFGPDGTHIVTFGRAGAGPGEFKQPWGFDVDSAGRSHVIDHGNSRYSIFGADGELIEEKRRFASGNIAPWPGAFLDDGRVVDVDFEFAAAGPRRTYMIHAPDGTVLDTITMPEFESPSFMHSTESSRTSASIPFSPDLELRFDPRGYLWAGISDQYRILQLTLDGRDTIRIIDRAYDAVPVAASERAAAIERLSWFVDQGGRIDADRIPDRHAAFSDIHVDSEGFVWVEPVTARQDDITVETLFAPRAAVFDVFDPEGRYLGRIDAAVPLSQPVILRDRVHAITVDDLGVQYIVRMRIAGRS